jgi:hypothetical protein
MKAGAPVGDLFQQLGKRVDSNARRAVQVYRRELPDFRAIEGTGGPAAMLDFAVLLRRRTIDLAEIEQPFTDDDLRLMESVGEERGERGISPAAQRQVLMLHSTLTLQELTEAAGPDDIDDTMRMLRWLGPQGLAAQAAYTRGYLVGQRRSVPFASRVQRLALLLIGDDPGAGQLLRDLSMAESPHHLVTVVHIHGDLRRYTSKMRAATVDALLQTHRTPLMWRDRAEFVALTPTADATTSVATADQKRALTVVRDLVDTLGQPCSIGTAVGYTGQLAATTDLARRISRVAPAQAKARHLHTLADVFVELAVAQVPEVDRWLVGLVQRLDTGPDLIETLAAFYRNDMNRLRTAAALNIHPRTLDYRIRRAHELVGFHPATTRGVRLIGAGIAWAHARELPRGNGRST